MPRKIKSKKRSTSPNTIIFLIFFDFFRVKCETCNLFLWEKDLERHKVKVHSYLSPKMYECDLCGLNKSIKSDLLIHMKVRNLINCLITILKFKLFQKSHIQKVPCNICGKMLSSERTVEKHIRFVHERKVQNICELCGLDFPSNYSYVNHMRIKHTGNVVRPSAY